MRKPLVRTLICRITTNLGQVVKYDFSTPDEIPERVKDAQVLVINKAPMNEKTLRQAEKLKLICVTATGTNNLDKAYLEQRGIAWRNVADYSTHSVAQHTFAMLFYLMEHLRYYDDYVKQDRYTNDRCFTHFEKHFSELTGKTWGIIGLGNIGRQVAKAAGLLVRGSFTILLPARRGRMDTSR